MRSIAMTILILGVSGTAFGDLQLTAKVKKASIKKTELKGGQTGSIDLEVTVKNDSDRFVSAGARSFSIRWFNEGADKPNPDSTLEVDLPKNLADQRPIPEGKEATYAIPLKTGTIAPEVGKRYKLTVEFEGAKAQTVFEFKK